MAYVGVNKAQNESSKFLIDEQANINAFGTILNTASQVGQEIYNGIKTSQAQELNRTLSPKFQEAEQEIYNNASIPPNERQKALESRYQQIIESEKANGNKLPGVYKQIWNNAKDRALKKSEDWNAEDLQLAEKARLATGYSKLDSTIATNDIIGELKTYGSIKDKGYVQKPEEDTVDFGDSFIGNERQDAPVKDDEDFLFDPELHTLAYSGASEYDIRVAVINKTAKDMYPHNKDMQNEIVRKYTKELMDSLPSQDLELNFSQAFSESDPSSWGSYSDFYNSYAKELDTIEYGGKTLTPEKKRQLLSNLDTMWKNLNTRVDTAATEIYNKEIAPVIQGLRNKQAMNSNSIYTTEDVNKAFDSVLKDNPGMADFLIAERENQLTVARNNERIIQQRRYKTLYLSNSERTKEENEEFLNLSKTFSEDEIATLKQQALVQAGNVQAMREYEKSGVGYQTQADIFNKVLKEVESIEFRSTEELDRYLESQKGVLTSDQMASLRQSGDSAMNRRNIYKSEAVDKVNKDLTQAILDGSTLSKAYGKTLLEKHGVTDPTVEASVYKAIEMKNQEKVVNSFYDQFMSGKLTDESLTQMIEDNEIEDNKFVFGLKEMMNNQSLKDANDKVYELINSGSFTEESLKTVLEDFSITDENVKYTLNTMLENSKLTNFQNKIGALDTEGNLDINTLKAAISENKIDESKNAAFLNQYYQRAKQLSVEKANNELQTKLYRGTLSNTSLSEVGGKFGLTVEENPEFFNSWKNQTENVKIENATKMYNSLNFDDSITVEQVNNIAETFGLTAEDKLYKDMKTVAEQNWQKHLDTLGGTSAGFGEKTTEAGIKMVGGAITDYMNGKISRSDALAILAEQRGSLTEADYKEKYNQIGNEYMMKKNASDAIFEDAGGCNIVCVNGNLLC